MSAAAALFDEAKISPAIVPEAPKEILKVPFSFLLIYNNICIILL